MLNVSKLSKKILETFSNLPSLKTSGAIYKGPRNNRTITGKSFIEFGSRDDARAAMKILKDAPSPAGFTIKIKAALTKVNGSRNWALGEAERMLIDFVKNNQEKPQVTIEWKERCVKIGTEICFSQEPADLKGKFVGIASHLNLP